MNLSRKIFRLKKTFRIKGFGDKISKAFFFGENLLNEEIFYIIHNLNVPLCFGIRSKFACENFRTTKA
jgi:hypothetical protein